jgi:hypothetical protein
VYRDIISSKAAVSHARMRIANLDRSCSICFSPVFYM